MNEAYRLALLVERAALEPFATHSSSKARRLAEVDAQLAPSAADARAAHFAAPIETPEPAAEIQASAEPTAAASESAADQTPIETAVAPRRGRQTTKEK